MLNSFKDLKVKIKASNCVYYDTLCVVRNCKLRYKLFS